MTIYDNLMVQVDKLRRHNRQGAYKTRGRYYEAMQRLCRFLAEEYRLQKLANLKPEHISAYVEHMQEKGLSASTIKTDLAAIRFYHDLISNTRYKLPANDELYLSRRSYVDVDRTWSAAEFDRMIQEARRAHREDYITILYLGRYMGLRIHECFRFDAATVRQALKEQALTVKGKGGLVRKVPLDSRLVERLQMHLAHTDPGRKLFVPDIMDTHTAIRRLEAFVRDHREVVQDTDSDYPLTFHGLRHTKAAEWYQEFIARGKNKYEARKAVSALLGHKRDDVTKIYLASLQGTDSGIIFHHPPQNS